MTSKEVQEIVEKIATPIEDTAYKELFIEFGVLCAESILKLNDLKQKLKK